MTEYSDIRLWLAPMAGVTDHAFRKICRSFGADMTLTEMISAKAIHYRDEKTAILAELFDDDENTAVQIFGSEPDIMAEAAKSISENGYAYCRSKRKPVAIDINMGCPAPKVANNGDGSALLRNPKLAAEIVSACVKATDLPVTVKMRIGWDESSIVGVEFAKQMEVAGASLIAVHGRTREGRFSAPINFGEIAAIKKAVKIPVIGNGEIFSGADAKRMLERTGCDGLMIGRGAMGNPWLFSEIKAILSGKEFVPPTVKDRVETALSQLRIAISEKGEHMAILQARGQLAWYLKGIRGSAFARGKLNEAVTYRDVENLLLPMTEE